MGHFKKTALIILLAVGMTLGMMPVMSQISYAEEPIRIIVGGIPVRAEHKEDESGKWVFDYDSRYGGTLTLNSFSIYGYSQGGYISYYDVAPLTIVVKGTNSITNTSESDPGIIAVSDQADISITGSGTLTIKAGGDAIKTNGGIEISDGTVNATSTKGGVAILAKGGIEISGGTVNATGKGSNDSSGSNVGAGIKSDSGDITIRGGDVTATSDVKGVGSYAILANKGNVTISGDSKVAAKGGYWSIRAGSDDSGADKGNVTISGGTVTAEGGTFGISSVADVIISGGTVTASASGYNGTAISGSVTNVFKGIGRKRATGAEEPIGIGSGQRLDDYDVVKFPADKAQVTEVPSAMDLTYNGSEQELVTAGKASDGEIRYATGTATGAGGSYSTSIPKGTEAGDYYVWYKAVGDAAHNDSEEAYVKVTISEKSADPGDDPGTDPGSDQTPTESVPEAVGTAHKAGAGTYVVRSADTVWLTKVAKNRKSFTVPAGVNINGKIFAVTGINARAFKGTKVRTLTVRTKALTKSSVRASLKGSKIRTVKVSGGRKKVKRQYVKKYRKIFTKKNAGRKVRVK